MKRTSSPVWARPGGPQVAPTGRATADRDGAARPDPADGRRKSALGRAPRFHGELLKFGFEVARSSVAKYMVKRHGPPSQGWRAFLWSQAPGIAAMDLFVVPTIGLDPTCGRHTPTECHGHPGQAHCTGLTVAEWRCRTADRLDPTCVDHIIVLGEAHLSRILKSYARYYNETRSHLALDQDAPVSRPVQRTDGGRSLAILGGLHHHYLRV
jgi:hypothetical protein